MTDREGSLWIGSLGSGFGLTSISERARMLAAMYVVQSAVGQGTTIILNLETQNERPEK